MLDPHVASLQPSLLAVGDRFTWKSHPVELVDVANLDHNWFQALVRFLDDPNRPAVSMPYADLIAGIAP